MFSFLNWKNKAAERCIFRYFDGEKWRGIDPALAARKFYKHPKHNMAEVIKDYRQEIPEGCPEELAKEIADGVLAAKIAIVEVGRDVLEVAAYDHQKEIGLTEDEVVETLADFFDYIEEIKKKRSTRRTSLPRSESSFAANSPQPSGVG